ncbi:MAG: hypothetical protein EOP83_06440 [Verrucomicrobiaceae bacterium]|nr:MAG: hypothetical protein EOP83_06440 [Verrucomicrobiaceae bacterium]
MAIPLMLHHGSPRFSHSIEAATKEAKLSARIGKTSAHDPAAIAAALGSADRENVEVALEVLLPDLTKRDVAAAAELARSLEPWAQREQALLFVAGAWADSDPEAGAQWCRSLADAEEQLHCLRALCNRLATTDPARAIALVEANGETDTKVLAQEIMQHWPRRDPKAAIAWVENRRDPELKDSLWNHLALSFAEIDPQQAANLAAERIVSEKIQDEAVISVVHQWVLKDRKAAAEWVELFPEGPLRERARGELVDPR